MAIRLAVLGSGSGGNSTLVEGGGTRVLVDAGFSCRQLTQRLRFVGLDPAAIDALLITHEHGDHVGGAETFADAYGVPIYCTRGTAAAAGFGEGNAVVRTVAGGQPFDLGALRVRPFAVPHDAAETVGYVLEADGARAGYVTDLGHGPGTLREELRDCDLLVVESNHDLDMLRLGPYPEHIKARVLGQHGHLDNQTAADILGDVVGRTTRAVVLAHLSETNNRPGLALDAVRQRLDECGRRVPALHAAEQRRPSPWFEV